MTVRAGQLREGSLVLHSVWSGAEGNQEELEFVKPFMSEPVGALGEQRVGRPQKDQGELRADLPLGPRSALFATFGRLNEPQSVGGPIGRLKVEDLPHYVDEVAAREPLKVCHPVIVSASANKSGTGV